MASTVRSILPTHTDKPDFNGDGFTDIVWRGAEGTIAVWNMSQDGSTPRAGLLAPSPGGLVLQGYGDWNGDGTTDLIWQGSGGATETWTVRDNQVAFVVQLGTAAQIQAIGDFDGNGHDDLLWQRSDGSWFMGSAEARKIPPIGLGNLIPIDPDYQLVGVGDFDGDGRDGLLFRGAGGILLHEPTGALPSNGQVPTRAINLPDPGAEWQVIGMADFNGDGCDDILWQHTDAAGQVDGRAMWLMEGGQIISGSMILDPGPDWDVVGIGDYNNDGRADLLWHSVSQPGLYSEWLMNGSAFQSQGATWDLGTDFWSIA